MLLRVRGWRSLLLSKEKLLFMHYPVCPILTIEPSIVFANSWLCTISYDTTLQWLFCEFPQFLLSKELCTVHVPSIKLKTRMSSNRFSLLLHLVILNWQLLFHSGLAADFLSLKDVSITYIFQRSFRFRICWGWSCLVLVLSQPNIYSGLIQQRMWKVFLLLYLYENNSRKRFSEEKQEKYIYPSAKSRQCGWETSQ